MGWKQTEHNDEELRALDSDHFYCPRSMDNDAIKVAVDDDAIKVAVGLRLGAHCADPTHAVIVVHRLTFRQHTDLVVDRVRTANIATLL